MAHFDMDPEKAAGLKEAGWKKNSPLDILDINEVSFELSPEELEAALKPFDSIEESRDSESDSEA